MEAGKYLEKKYPYYFPSSRENIEVIWKSAYSVVGQTFIMLKVVGTNAYAMTTFSQRAFVMCEPMESEKQITMQRTLFCFSLSDICPEPFIKFSSVKGDWDALDTSIKDAMACLHKYLTEFDVVHKPCLKKMWEASLPLPESHVHSVLACHLFAELASNSDLLIDENTYDGKGCPWCSIQVSNVCKANTSFGHPQYWHGRADIVIVHKGDKSTNVITVASPEETEVESIVLEESGELENTRETLTEVKQIFPVNYNEFSNTCMLRSQILSQTITNGFLVCKQNSSLEDNLIPCFLASNKHIAINMYNPKSDVLLTQGDYLELIDRKGQVNEELIFQLWLASNLNLFKQNIVQNKDFQGCGFLDSLPEEVKNIYKYHLSTNLEPQIPLGNHDKAVVNIESCQTLLRRAREEGALLDS